MDTAQDDILIERTGTILAQANTDYSARRFSKAWPQYVEALEIGGKFMSHLQQLDIRTCLTDCLVWCKKYRKAEKYDRQTLQLLESWIDEYGPEHDITVRIRQNLARHLSAIFDSDKSEVRKLEEAVQLHRQNLSILGSRHSKNDPNLLGIQDSLVYDLAKQGKLQEAATLIEDVLRQREALSSDRTDRNIIESRHNYAVVLYGLKRFEEAKRLLLHNEEVLQSLPELRKADYERLVQKGERYLKACIEATSDLALSVKRQNCKTTNSGANQDRNAKPDKAKSGGSVALRDGTKKQKQKQNQDQDQNQDRDQTQNTVNPPSVPSTEVSYVSPSHKPNTIRSHSDLPPLGTTSPVVPQQAYEIKKSKSDQSLPKKDSSLKETGTHPPVSTTKGPGSETTPKSVGHSDSKKRTEAEDPSSRLLPVKSTDPSRISSSPNRTSDRDNRRKSSSPQPDKDPKVGESKDNRQTGSQANDTDSRSKSKYLTKTDLLQADKSGLHQDHHELKRSKSDASSAKQSPQSGSKSSRRNHSTTGSKEQKNAPVPQVDLQSDNIGLHQDYHAPKSPRSDASSAKQKPQTEKQRPQTESKTENRTKSTTASKEQIDTATGQADPGNLFRINEPRNDADKWFYWLRRYTHNLLYNEKVKPKNPGRRRVRVAILDSGITYQREGADEYHSKANKWLSRGIRKHRVKEYKDFTGQHPSQTDSGEDYHGTNCTSLLLQTAPEVDIYCANVVVRGVQGMEPRHVADALAWAIDEWKVDIISMSFGWDYIWQEVDEQIDHARRSNVLVFAATNNESGFSKDHGSFPSCQPTVFCAYACSGAGVLSTHNPDASREKINFMFLGEGISLLNDSASGLLTPISPDNDHRLTGNSFAAPIAAGIAALVLDLARLQLAPRSDEIKKVEWRLKRYEGMAAVFRRMSGEQPKLSEYHFVRPWRFLGVPKPPFQGDGVDQTHAWWTLCEMMGPLNRFGDL